MLPPTKTCLGPTEAWKDQKGFFPGTYEMSVGFQIPRLWTSHLWTCKRINFCCLIHLVCGDVRTAPVIQFRVEMHGLQDLGSGIWQPKLIPRSSTLRLSDSEPATQSPNLKFLSLKLRIMLLTFSCDLYKNQFITIETSQNCM